MTLSACFQKAFLNLIDTLFALYPQPIPSKERLKQCKLISHRGVYDNRNVFENTLPAFDKIKDTGVWGIEFDIRWTKDLYPVVFHDRDLNRIFGSNQEISRLDLAELKKSFPLIPTLEEMTTRYGQKLHLLVEIKEELYPDPVYQSRVLNDVLAPLKPLIDYHLISLNPNMFQWIDSLPKNTFLLIAEINVASISKIVIKENYQGMLGHYLLITDTILKKHQQNRQMIGTGFINSKNCLFRELNRGVTWIFSQNAIEMQAVRDRLLNDH